MKKEYIIITVLLVLVVYFAAFKGHEGRYALSSGQGKYGEVWILDTRTGELWLRVLDKTVAFGKMNEIKPLWREEDTEAVESLSSQEDTEAVESFPNEGEIEAPKFKLVPLPKE